MKQKIKTLVLGKTRPIRIRFGLGSGIIMNLNPQHTSQVIFGLAEAEIAQKFKDYTLGADVFFDIGSAAGFYGLAFRKFNPTGVVYMFDAEPTFVAIQKQNLNLNEWGSNFFLYTRFVSDSISEQTITIDSLMDQLKLSDKRLFFKIDVDGGEERVLKGMMNTLRQNSCRLIVETHSLVLEKNCIHILESKGFSTQIVKNAWWRFFIKENRPIAHNRWVYAWNYIKGRVN